MTASLDSVLTPLESDATLLLTVLKPVDNELRPVETDATLLLVVLKPVDNELIPVDSQLAVVDVDVDRDATALVLVLNVVDRFSMAELVANSCEPLMASVLAALTRPAATLVI
nr:MULTISPECIES: hypothetical protein [Burkholderia cepacia complex]